MQCTSCEVKLTNAKGRSGGLILSLDSGSRISAHVLSIIKQALCLCLGIREGGGRQRANFKGLMIQGWKQVTDQKSNHHQHTDRVALMRGLQTQFTGGECLVQEGSRGLALTSCYNPHLWALVFLTCKENIHFRHLKFNVTDRCLIEWNSVFFRDLKAGELGWRFYNSGVLGRGFLVGCIFRESLSLLFLL